ncbi:class IV adenylate cyclase [Halococcus sp. AFM35]|uniref:class IV adenylate cyclase n=1 Tax=Halococcus sp. AFM35 TaxID=3421653 RepID=UPI003EBDC57F
MYEVECKVASAHEPVRERLVALDADAIGTVEQVDTYYDAPHRSFPETDEALRIRQEDGATRLTYKGPLVDADSKTRAEHETGVESDEAMANVLDALGFAPAATVEKTREKFRCRGYTVALDAVSGLGEFVEVEGEADMETDIEHVRDGAHDLLAALDCDPADQIRTSYLELLLESGANE